MKAPKPTRPDKDPIAKTASYGQMKQALRDLGYTNQEIRDMVGDTHGGREKKVIASTLVTALNGNVAKQKRIGRRPAKVTKKAPVRAGQ